ncbi:MAG: galactokinase [Lachnospiraceae bacterium]|nr:galactokinase [Lachnospiraceae bacterium]
MKEIQPSLLRIYGEEAAAQQLRYEKLGETFRRSFGREPGDFFRAPGRVEIGGNHTDHQHGVALAAAVTLDTAAAVGRRTDKKLLLKSEGYPDCGIDLSESLAVREEEKGTTQGILRGMAAAFAERGASFEAGGFQACITSNVPAGSGLSSSAAFEILLGTILNEYYYDGRADREELARIGQWVENRYFGKPCGLMDQLASSLGGAVLMDFEDPARPRTEKLDFDLRQAGYTLCILKTGAGHENLTDEYAAIPAECGAVAAFFGKNVLREVPEEAFTAAIPALRETCGDRAVLRALHVYEENRRARAEAEAVREGRIADFLKLVDRSGRSSVECLQNVTPSGAVLHQEMMITLACSQKLLAGEGAVRVHGGGFGGTAEAFVPNEAFPLFKARMETVLGDESVIALRICPAGGTRL